MFVRSDQCAVLFDLQRSTRKSTLRLHSTSALTAAVVWPPPSALSLTFATPPMPVDCFGARADRFSCSCHAAVLKNLPKPYEHICDQPNMDAEAEFLGEPEVCRQFTANEQQAMLMLYTSLHRQRSLQETQRGSRCGSTGLPVARLEHLQWRWAQPQGSYQGARS